MRRKRSRDGRRPRPSSTFSSTSARGSRRTMSGSPSRNFGRTSGPTRTTPKRPRMREMTTMKANRLVAISIVLLALAGPAGAQGVAWDDLSDAQQRLLAPHQQRWAELEPQRQQQIARGAERWLEMNRGDRAQAQDRFEIWRGMSDEQRAAARQRYQEFRRLPPDDRDRLIDTYRRSRIMPPERQNALRQRFRELTPEQRQTLRDRRMRQPAPLQR